MWVAERKFFRAEVECFLRLDGGEEIFRADVECFLGLDGGERFFELMSSIFEDWVEEKIFRTDVGYLLGVGWWREIFSS